MNDCNGPGCLVLVAPDSASPHFCSDWCYGQYQARANDAAPFTDDELHLRIPSMVAERAERMAKYENRTEGAA